MDEAAEAQRGCVTCPRPRSTHAEELDLDPGGLTLGIVLFISALPCFSRAAAPSLVSPPPPPFFTKALAQGLRGHGRPC